MKTALLICLTFCISVRAELELLATHPKAKIQPTAIGKSIHTMTHFQGHIYMGYGDYGENTGPIEICRFPVETGAVFCDFVLFSEQVSVMREIEGKLYIPAIDPSPQGSHAYVVYDGSHWVTYSESALFQGSIPPAHIFDVAMYGQHLWLSGSQRTSAEVGVPPFDTKGDATVWKGALNGQSWSVSLDLEQVDNCCARAYFLGIYQNELYVQAVDYDEIHPRSHVFNGSVWRRGPNILRYGSGEKAREFADEMLMLQSGRLVSFNGVATNIVRDLVIDYTIFDGYIYAIGYNNQIHRSSNTKDWEFVDEIKDRVIPSSIEVHENRLFVGTKDSKIYRATIEPQESNDGSDILLLITPLL